MLLLLALYTKADAICPLNLSLLIYEINIESKISIIMEVTGDSANCSEVKINNC